MHLILSLMHIVILVLIFPKSSNRQTAQHNTTQYNTIQHIITDSEPLSSESLVNSSRLNRYHGISVDQQCHSSYGLLHSRHRVSWSSYSRKRSPRLSLNQQRDGIYTAILCKDGLSGLY
jgi:hypothetical protein